MNFRLLIATLCLVYCSSCLKSGDNNSCRSVAPETEAPVMKAYCDSVGITYTTLSNGLFYQIITAGAGAAPTASSKVTVTYKGSLLNGTVFDERTEAISFYVNKLILGWQAGLPLIKKGGRILLVVPSYMGYGCSGASGIAGNSILFFDITLVDVE